MGRTLTRDLLNVRKNRNVMFISVNHASVAETTSLELHKARICSRLSFTHLQRKHTDLYPVCVDKSTDVFNPSDLQALSLMKACVHWLDILYLYVITRYSGVYVVQWAKCVSEQIFKGRVTGMAMLRWICQIWENDRGLAVFGLLGVWPELWSAILSIWLNPTMTYTTDKRKHFISQTRRINIRC